MGLSGCEVVDCSELTRTDRPTEGDARTLQGRFTRRDGVVFPAPVEGVNVDG